MAVDIRITRWAKAQKEAIDRAMVHVPGARIADLQENAESWKLIAQWLEKQLLQETPLQSALDAGCGIGLASAYLKVLNPSCAVTCIDRQHPNLALTETCVRIRGDLTTLSRAISPVPKPGQDGIFNAVLLLDVLPYLPSPQVALSCLRTLLAPNGVLYISLPDAVQQGRTFKYGTCLNEILTYQGEVAQGDVLWSYTKEEVIALIESIGLVVRRFGYAVADGTRDGIVGHSSRHLNFAITK